MGGKLILCTDRLCFECWFVCQNIQSQFYSAALCVMCLSLSSSGIQISIHPTKVAFKLLWEPFCFVTHNNFMDYCVGLSSKIYPTFRQLLTCYSIAVSSPHIAENRHGHNFDIDLHRIISCPSLILL